MISKAFLCSSIITAQDNETLHSSPLGPAQQAKCWSSPDSCNSLRETIGRSTFQPVQTPNPVLFTDTLGQRGAQ